MTNMSTDQPAAHPIDPVDVTTEKTAPRRRKRPLRTYSRRSIQTREQDQEEESPQGNRCHPTTTPELERTETPVQLAELPTRRYAEQVQPAERSNRTSILAYFKPLPPISDAPSSIASSDLAEPLPTPPIFRPSHRAKKRRRLTTKPQFSGLEQHIGSDAGDTTVDPGDGDGDGDGKGGDEFSGTTGVGKESSRSLSESTMIVKGTSNGTLRPALSEVAVNALCRQDEPTSSVADGKPRIKERLDKRPAKDMTQTTLSLSVHKEPGFTMCSVCDILYNPLNEKDRREHNRRHAAFSRNKKRRAL